MLVTLGVVGGSFAYARAMEFLNDQSLVIPLLSLSTVFAAVGVALVPETARRELEQISDEGVSV